MTVWIYEEAVCIVTSGVGESANGHVPVSQMSEGEICRSSGYTDSLLSALSELQRQNHFCDVTLTSDDGTFKTKVHKVLLVAASGYLRSLLLDPDLTVRDQITVPSMWTHPLSCCRNNCFVSTYIPLNMHMSQGILFTTEDIKPSTIKACILLSNKPTIYHAIMTV